MAKERSTDKEERRKEKKDKKEKKEKRSEKDGVHKSKREKEKLLVTAAEEANITTKLLNGLEEEKLGSLIVKKDGEVKIKVKSAPLLGALVPFANPLADDKVGKKVLKSVKKGKFLFSQISSEVAKCYLV